MKVLSLNLDVKQVASFQRLEILGKLITENRPDFVALQSVTQDTIKKISSQPWAASYTVASVPVTFETRLKPTCAILSLYPSEETKVFEYRNPDSPHQLVYARFVLLDKQKQSFYVTVASTQILSGSSKEDSVVREKHLNQAMYTLGEAEDCILVGDFGMNEEVDGSPQLFAGWKDAWLVTAAEGKGVTCASTSTRSDRIFFRMRRYRASSVEVVFGDQIPELGASCLSSHFGLLATFSDVEGILPKNSAYDLPCMFSRPSQVLLS